ncbi:hypothetical protein PHMEG_00021313 [Phytophthora megakarya]|uniref:Uncharacterized protein n=1 Tax=Phytophthora megakarya TaxID=4795 RepID=A0A225VM71_9STRA|nr:hypothetical protein PHMEG_00021313 [Phytophthora megakarya]
MNLSDLKLANTKRAQTTVLASFERYLFSEGTSTAYMGTLIVADPARAGAMLVTIMDKFGVHFAFQEGNGKAAYYCQVKCWLMDQYPQHCGLVEIQLLKQGRTLGQHCIKRESSGFTKKPPHVLKKKMMYLNTNASTPTIKTLVYCVCSGTCSDIPPIRVSCATAAFNRC